MKKNLLNRRRRRRRRDTISLGILLTLLSLLLFLYVVLLQIEDQTKKQNLVEKNNMSIKVGSYVVIKQSEINTVPIDLKENLGKVGRVVEIIENKNKVDREYLITFSLDAPSFKVKQTAIAEVKPNHHIGEKIKLFQNGSISEEGVITVIDRSIDGAFLYEAKFNNIGYYTEITDNEIVPRRQVPLSQKNSREENNKILKKVMSEVKNNPYTILDLPKGKFEIGSKTPEKDYLVLSSNVELNGTDTTLIVKGTAYWFGLATGREAIEGLSNFTMRNLNFEAHDKLKGDHFMLMANHGNNWLIENSTFTQVHKSSSHIFDLGAVQNAVFRNNTFIGSAPNMTDVKELPKDSIHPIIAEVIQLDSSDDTGVWDANLIKNIDPNYATNNAIKHISSNIIISGNKFLPYKDLNDNIISYGGSIGQHSSAVGYVEVTDNIFENPLVLRFSESSHNWLLHPIHLPPGTPSYVANNSIK